ncbi:4-hydroxy-tetrahydrodipicolinate reductase [Calditrichota bacterium]
MITVTLFGAGGRMGQAVLSALDSQPDIEISWAVDVPERDGEEIGQIELTGDSGENDFLSDVWVDVSLAGAAFKHALKAEKSGIPIIIGATGFTKKQSEYLENMKTAHIIAPNLSVGVNLLFHLLPQIRKTLSGGYDVAIAETHHRHKLDAPSGTAKKLAEVIESVRGPVQTTSLRIGEVTGEHRIIFASEGEEIEIVHRARSRMAFAQGVAPAVRFLAGLDSGNYSMVDVLGLK